MTYRALAMSLSVTFACAIIALARPSPPPAKMQVVIPTTMPALADIPVTLAFTFHSDEDRPIPAASLNFILLNEDGSQVAIDCLIPIGITNLPKLIGMEPRCQFALRCDPYQMAGIAASGKRFQLICTYKTPDGTLADSAWFTVVGAKR